MKMKKLLAATCAGAMALSLTVPAFAAGQAFDGQKTNFTAEIATDDIGSVSVAVPTSAKLYVNPYGALIQLKDGEENFGTGTSEMAIKQGSVSDTLFSQTRLVKNTGTQALDLKVVANSTQGTNASATVKAQFVAMKTDETTFESDTTVADSAPEMMGFFEIKTATVADGVASAVEWTDFADYDPAAKSGMVPIEVSGTPGTATTVCYTLPAATTEDVDDGYGGTTEVTVPSYAAFHLVGKLNPNVTSTVWANTTTDLPTVNVVFTFTPATVAP